MASGSCRYRLSCSLSGHELDVLEAHAGKFLVLKHGRMLGAKTAAGVKALLLPAAKREGQGAT